MKKGKNVLIQQNYHEVHSPMWELIHKRRIYEKFSDIINSLDVQYKEHNTEWWAHESEYVSYSDYSNNPMHTMKAYTPFLNEFCKNFGKGVWYTNLKYNFLFCMLDLNKKKLNFNHVIYLTRYIVDNHFFTGGREHRRQFSLPPIEVLPNFKWTDNCIDGVNNDLLLARFNMFKYTMIDAIRFYFQITDGAMSNRWSEFEIKGYDFNFDSTQTTESKSSLGTFKLNFYEKSKNFLVDIAVNYGVLKVNVNLFDLLHIYFANPNTHEILSYYNGDIKNVDITEVDKVSSITNTTIYGDLTYTDNFKRLFMDMFFLYKIYKNRNFLSECGVDGNIIKKMNTYYNFLFNNTALNNTESLMLLYGAIIDDSFSIESNMGKLLDRINHYASMWHICNINCIRFNSVSGFYAD